MTLHPDERVALFIDGVNLYQTARTLGFDIDYKRLLTAFAGRGRLVRAFYYTALQEEQDYSPIRPLIDWLDYNGYSVVTKPMRETYDASGRRKLRGSMDIEIAVDMLGLAERLDHAVLFSGDGDFRRLVEAVQAKGVRVSVVSTIRGATTMISDDLRRQADQFIDLADLAPQLARDNGRRDGPGAGDRPYESHNA
ncbi:MAG: NYN domain-containing protein [Alphaproteobacteria bacterium]|nr:NYN domain-containing protein [Alphaproteobacteria bacterium]